ncbi:MAG TPA: transglycosylase SLT domain-containing protein [Acidocella sp.]|nr:transglycosylase SLT domain-containing protein [Acidocella sp.]
MRRGLLCAAVMMLAAPSARAEVPDATACAMAGRAAEQAQGVPQGLLVSIGMVESGRADPLSGHVTPWPWTVNADGHGQYFASKEDAEAFVRLARSSGAHDVDVGCFQVSLESHPEAFATLGEAFDPADNANYAARYLTQLKGMTGTWNTAIADYHSSTPQLGLPYQRQVLAAWRGLGGVPLELAAGAGGYPASDPVVIMQSAIAKRIRVYSMDDPPSAGLHAGLPRVVTP